ncbi:MAG: flagellar export chaperone FlgN [Eubacterium sp.]|nr:flagellar export chaperone FlgN [Eubacterium sp.]
MENKMDNQVYVSMMMESLQKKKQILSSLYAGTKEQENLLLETELDVDRFSELIEEKGQGIDELESLDGGFDILFKKLEKELMANRASYSSEIETMKSLIRDITDLSTKIQVLEKRNHDRFQSYMSGEKERFRKANASQQTAMTYAKNMAGAHKPGNSYFVNETK